MKDKNDNLNIKKDKKTNLDFNFLFVFRIYGIH